MDKGCVHPSGCRQRKLVQAHARSHGGGDKGAEARRHLYTPGAGQLLVGALQLPLRRLREFLQRPLVPVGLATSPLGIATTGAGIAVAIAVAGRSIPARGGGAFWSAAIAGLLLCGACGRRRPSRASRCFLHYFPRWHEAHALIWQVPLQAGKRDSGAHRSSAGNVSTWHMRFDTLHFISSA